MTPPTTPVTTVTEDVVVSSSKAEATVTDPPPAELNASEDTPPKLPLPDEEFWLEDGNLTLIAGDVEFRVYKGPIVANSPVFKAMLTLPQPDGATQPQCTCNYAPALVHVSDSPEDLRHLLRALVPGRTPR